MKIAIAYEKSDETIYPHFGHSQYFLLADVANRRQEVLSNGGYSHKDLIPYLLKGLGVDVLICGGIGDMAVRLLQEAGIEVIFGIEGKAIKALDDFKKGRLKANISFLHKCGCGH